MTQLILIILGMALIAVFFGQKTRPLFRARLRQGKDKVAGICAVAIGLNAKKQGNKEKILALLAKRELANSDIRKSLGVSAASVVRYMDELEKEGKVEQVGAAGHAVTYKLR